MATITGSTSTLPGAQHALPAGMMCDTHPGRPAVARLQGETDSMGAELIDCCAECRDEIVAASRMGRTGCCDWCRQQATDLQDRRDFEEGRGGRVYEVCGACRSRDDARIDAEVGDFDESYYANACFDDPDWDDAEDGCEREYDDEDEECCADD